MAVKAENKLERNHAGQRPSWDCAACGQPWPCANARDLLLAEFRGCPSVLTIYMSAQMCEAVFDLTAHGTDPPRDLFDRFMSWVHLASTGTRDDDATAALPQAGSPRFEESSQPPERLPDRRTDSVTTRSRMPSHNATHYPDVSPE